MAQTALTKKKFSVYDYDAKIQCTFQLIEKELPKETVQLIRQYANVMTAQSMAKATIHKHLQTILNLSRYVGKSWNEITKDDIDALVAKIVQTYSDNGQETNTTHDHKKILKIFFRWFKLGSRSKDEVGDPPETKHIKIKRVKDNIIREDLITEEDRIKLLQACGENARDRAFITVILNIHAQELLWRISLISISSSDDKEKMQAGQDLKASYAQLVQAFGSYRDCQVHDGGPDEEKARMDS